jgi:hypothetical protein
MDHISGLRASLNGYFGWNKARMTCFVQMLLALFTARTVNLNRLAATMTGRAEQASKYRRMQRFFEKFPMDFGMIAIFVFRMFFVSGGKWKLTMDRTNWKWGKSNINILMLGIVYKGTAIPVFWELLDKKGNSDTPERIRMIERFIETFGRDGIEELLCDREFIGKDWFSWLKREGISFYIRIRKNLVTTNARGESAWMDTLFYGLKPGECRVLEGARKVTGAWVFLSALCLEDGELLIVATDCEADNAITRYAARWEIETLFGCLKGRGFHFEDTHMTDMARLKKLTALLAVAFAWAHKSGEWKSETKVIKIKKHGRPAVSLFRVGLDYVTTAIVNAFVRPNLIEGCLKMFQKMPGPGLTKATA